MSNGCPACGAPANTPDPACSSCSSRLPATAGGESPPSRGAVHLTPDGGMQIFLEPYPALGAARGPHISGREVVHLVDTRGTWVQLMWNGNVAGWVDGRGLIPPAAGLVARPGPPRPAALHQPVGVQTPSSAPAVTVDGLSGALAALSILVGGLIDWAQGFGSVTAFKIPMEFLVDPRTTARDPKLGYFLLVIGLVGVFTSFFGQSGGLRVVLGLLAVTVAVLFCGQIAAQIPDRGGISFTDVVGPGPWVTGIAGIALALSPLLKPKP